jgi:hypothetical protein
VSFIRAAVFAASALVATQAIATDAPKPTNPSYPMLFIDHQHVQNGIVPAVIVDVRNQSVLRFRIVGLSCRVMKDGRTATVADGVVMNVGPGEVASGQIMFINPDAAAGADSVECRVTSAA